MTDTMDAREARGSRLRQGIGLVSLLLLLAGCQYVSPTYWECRRQWDAHRAPSRNPGSTPLTRRMIERGEAELRDTYLEVCMGRVGI